MYKPHNTINLTTFNLLYTKIVKTNINLCFFKFIKSFNHIQNSNCFNINIFINIFIIHYKYKLNLYLVSLYKYYAALMITQLCHSKLYYRLILNDNRNIVLYQYKIKNNLYAYKKCHLLTHYNYLNIYNIYDISNNDNFNKKIFNLLNINKYKNNIYTKLNIFFKNTNFSIKFIFDNLLLDNYYNKYILKQINSVNKKFLFLLDLNFNKTNYFITLLKYNNYLTNELVVLKSWTPKNLKIVKRGSKDKKKTHIIEESCRQISSFLQNTFNIKSNQIVLKINSSIYIKQNLKAVNGLTADGMFFNKKLENNSIESIIYLNKNPHNGLRNKKIRRL